MLINPKPSLFCGKCVNNKSCDCLCHLKDVVSGQHFEIHEDNQKFIVKEHDLENFR